MIAQNPSLSWAKQMVGSLSYSYSSAVDASGNVYTTGAFSTDTDFDPGPGVFTLNGRGGTAISKLDALGNFVWAKGMRGLGPLSHSGARDIKLDANQNIYITGYFQGSVDFDPGPGVYILQSSDSSNFYIWDIFVCKLDASGNFVWAKKFGGGPGAEGKAISVDFNGNVYTTGYFLGTVDFDPGPGTYNLTTLSRRDVFISKLDAGGNFVYAIQIGASTPNKDYYGLSICVDNAGNLYTAGEFAGIGDFDPGPGIFNMTNVQSWDIFILKLNSSGNFIWAKQFGEPTFVNDGVAITLDANSNIYTTSNLGWISDFDPGPGVFNLDPINGTLFVSKLDLNGNFVWAKQFGGGNYNWARNIFLDNDKSIYTTGKFAGTADFDPGPGIYNLIGIGTDNIYVSKLDSLGNFGWAVQIGGPNTSVFTEGTSVKVDASKNVYVTGHFSNTADFDPCAGTYNLTPLGGFDNVFVVKLSYPSVSITGSSTTICSGTSVTFTATPTNEGPSPSYQWQVNGMNVGTNSATFTTNTLSNGDIVTVILTSNATCPLPASVTSNAISITVSPGGPASVSVTSTGSTICTGTNVTFTATPTNGGSTPVYQWQVNAVNAGTNSSTYTTNTLVNGDVVRVIMTSSLSCATGSPATSNSITMTVLPPGPASVNISSLSSTICSGTSITFTAIPTNGGSSPSYQWQVNAVNVGTNSSTYTTNTLSNGDAVRVIMTSNLSCATGSPATSNSITMNVTQSLTPSINIVATSTTICAGASVTFTGIPTNGGTTPGYQWQVNGSNAGTNNPVYTTNTLNNGDLIRCILTSNYVCVTTTNATSNVIQMTVNAPVIPSVSIAASATTICIGTLVTFTAIPVNGGATPSYQWKLNGVNVGSNNPSYSTNSIVNGDVISCILTNLNSCSAITTANSNSITMIVTATVVPSLSITSTANDICPYASVTFTAIPANIGTTASYQWQLNGTNVGGNNLTYVNNSFTNGDKINCIMNTVTSCSSTPLFYSDTITMIVKPIPVISFNPSNPTIPLGSSVQLNATVTGNLASYLWTPSTGLNNSAILNPIANPVTTTVYNLNVVATNSCYTNKALTVTVFKDIYIPNSFTPNGDTKNDIFRIPPGTSLILQYFIIYDRYGNEIFKTVDINKGWDGTYKGVKSPNGTYTYIIKGSDSKGKIFLNGTVLVIR